MPRKSVRLDDRANVFIRKKLNMPPETAWKLLPNARKQHGSYTLQAVLPQVRGKRGQKKKYFMDSAAKFCVDEEARLSFATKEEAESATNRMDAARRLVRYVLSANANKRNSGCSGTANSSTAAPETVVSYAVAIASASRPKSETCDDWTQKRVKWGAGSRGSQALILASKARALLDGRPNASKEDVKAMAKSGLRHRILPSFFAESEGLSSDDIIDHLLENTAA